jgi:hypothetical protein
MPSDEAFLLAAAAGGGIVTTLADYVRYLPADAAGITASVLAVGAATITWARKHREAKNADRSKG